MTIAEWIQARASDVPRTLTVDVMAGLGDDARLPVSETPRACIAAAARLLESLQQERAFGRDTAGRLLAADALTTYAFEYAAESHPTTAQLATLARHAARDVGARLA